MRFEDEDEDERDDIFIEGYGISWICTTPCSTIWVHFSSLGSSRLILSSVKWVNFLEWANKPPMKLKEKCGQLANIN